MGNSEGAPLKYKGVTFDTLSVFECSYRDVFIQMNWIVLNAVRDEKVICDSQKSHLWDGEDVHKLLYFGSL